MGKTIRHLLVSNIFRLLGFLTFLVFIGTYLSACSKANSSSGHTQIESTLLAMQAQLETTNRELKALRSEIEAAQESSSAGSITATFCTSQGRALDLGASFAAGFPMDFGIVGTVGTLVLPGLWASPVALIPNEAGVYFDFQHGRGTDVCVELPIEVGPNDTALLAELAQDINAKANDFPERGKFQRRAHRLLNYTKRRVPGIQTRTGSNSILVDDDASDDEFDRLDGAVDNLMSAGLQLPDTSLGLFKDSNLADIVDSYDGIANLDSFIRSPEQFLEGLPNLFDFNCDDIGVLANERASNNNLGSLCDKLDQLPSLEGVGTAIESINGLSDEILAAIGELGPDFGNPDIDDPVQRKQEFCKTNVGRRTAFKKYCGPLWRK